MFVNATKTQPLGRQLGIASYQIDPHILCILMTNISHSKQKIIDHTPAQQISEQVYAVFLNHIN